MTYAVQDPQDAFEWEQWFADHRHFQDVRLGSTNTLSVPVPSERTGRLLNQETLRYLSSKDLLTTQVEEEED